MHSLIFLSYVFYLFCHSRFAMFGFDLFHIQLSAVRWGFVKSIILMNVRRYIYIYILCMCVCMYVCMYVCMDG